MRRNRSLLWLLILALPAGPARADNTASVSDGPRVIPGVKIAPSAQCIVAWETMLAAHTAVEATSPDPQSMPPRPEADLERTVGDPPQEVAAPPGGGASAPTLGLRFKAAVRADTIDDIFPEGIRPPDTMGAVGPDHFMEVINNNVSIFNKISGNRLSSVPLIDFFAEVHNEDIPFDPRVVFDHHSGRWVVMAGDCRCDPNWIVFAVSLTDDPTGDWFMASFPANGFADYPTLGVDEEGIYIAANITERVWAIDKAPLLGDPPTVGTITEWVVTINGALQPAHTYGATASQYLVQRSSSSALQVFEIRGPLTSPTLVDNGTLSVPASTSPPNAPALGSTTPISVGNGAGYHLQMSVFRDGSLWTCHTIGVSGRCACRWYEIDPVGMVLLQSGTVDDPSLHYYYPSVMVNEVGDAAMGFSGSDATQYVATYFTGRLSKDIPGQMADPVLLKAGEASYNVVDSYGRNRWGDYSYTTLDPVDERTFWTIQEYAYSPENQWGTWVGQLSFDGFDCNGNGVPDEDDIANGDSPDDNGNGVPDECECPWDCDGSYDGTVGIADFLAVLAQWGESGGSCHFGGDPAVGIQEFLDVLANWGPCP
jgi:hypothetical protein